MGSNSVRIKYDESNYDSTPRFLPFSKPTKTTTSTARESLDSSNQYGKRLLDKRR